MIDAGLLLQVVISLLVFGVLYWGISQIAAVIPGVPAFIVVVIRVLLVVFFLLYLLKLFGVLVGATMH